jgi:hypothetical protein
MTQEITRGFHDCQKAIQRIEMMVRDARHQGGVSKADETMARNIQISLASRVQEVSAGFRKKQSNYLKSKSPGENGDDRLLSTLLIVLKSCEHSAALPFPSSARLPLLKTHT